MNKVARRYSAWDPEPVRPRGLVKLEAERLTRRLLDEAEKVQRFAASRRRLRNPADRKTSFAKPSRPDGCVYIVGVGSVVKIGTSTKLRSRFAALQGGIPAELKLLATFPGSYGTERWLHDRFRAHHVRGEWFRLAGDFAEWVRESAVRFRDGSLTRDLALSLAKR